ncbi:MAG: lactate racemase domain-containing protein [Gaiellaceae bacterium]
MARVPLLAGSRVLAVEVPKGAVVLRPPPPAQPLDDVTAAVRDALRFPLDGRPLAELVPRGGRATVVVEPAALPLPGVVHDPRQAAIEATVDALAAAGVPVERQTLLVTAGLARRAGRHELETLVLPDFARRFRGRVCVHDAEDESLVELGRPNGGRLRANRCLVDTDAVVSVTAAESVLHGGPATLLAGTGAETLRSASAFSLLETRASEAWRLGVELEHALGERVALIGVSLALGNPTLTGALHGYPHDPAALEAAARLPFQRVFSRLPGALRTRLLGRIPRELRATDVFAGPPSVAHAEALLRAVAARGARVPEPLDAICIGIPDVSPYLPREPPNPLLAAYLGLGLALRLWRDRPPVPEGGTAILVHRFRRRFPHPSQHPYRVFFQTVRDARDVEALAEAESTAARDRRALAAYRDGRACHPLLPFADWRACGPALSGLGSVLVAGCRDASAARALGFVPAQSLQAALAMTRGLAEGAEPRIGFVPSPPYFPLLGP